MRPEPRWVAWAQYVFGPHAESTAGSPRARSRSYALESELPCLPRRTRVSEVRGLYAIVDVTASRRLGLEPLAVAEALLDARPACLQLRAKELAPRATIALLKQIASLAHRANTPLFANDRPDLAILGGCDGVHVGQDDLAPSDVQTISELASRRLMVGLSTHNEVQLREALGLSLDYLAIGPVFSTLNKANPDAVLGLDGLRALVALARSVRPSLPIVAIGGLNQPRCGEIAGLVDMVAVIGALLPSEPVPTQAALDSIRRRAEEIGQSFRSAREIADVGAAR